MAVRLISKQEGKELKRKFSRLPKGTDLILLTSEES